MKTKNQKSKNSMNPNKDNTEKPTARYTYYDAIAEN